ncbi:MAG: hypothetical protein KIT84_11325 [Labilithrix sp.]|nr:hypothetical protein [Labilithrix sp.]MCW5811600.1 hypothetical protein [Labilithrix sp.]
MADGSQHVSFSLGEQQLAFGALVFWVVDPIVFVTSSFVFIRQLQVWTPLEALTPEDVDR